MSTAKNVSRCEIEDCGKEAVSKGYCPTHYQQHRRASRGEGRPVGEVKQIAKPGEGDAVSFKLDRTRKDKVKALAEREGVDTAELWREAVDLLLAKRTDRSPKWKQIRELLKAE